MRAIVYNGNREICADSRCNVEDIHDAHKGFDSVTIESVIAGMKRTIRKYAEYAAVSLPVTGDESLYRGLYMLDCDGPYHP